MSFCVMHWFAFMHMYTSMHNYTFIHALMHGTCCIKFQSCWSKASVLWHSISKHFVQPSDLNEQIKCVTVKDFFTILIPACSARFVSFLGPNLFEEAYTTVRFKNLNPVWNPLKVIHIFLVCLLLYGSLSDKKLLIKNWLFFSRTFQH